MLEAVATLWTVAGAARRGLERSAIMLADGNLDPVALLRTRSLARASSIQFAAGGGRHGTPFSPAMALPETPVENVIALVEAVHEISRESGV